jgi:putative salt-induced outer membrane protein YdiY
MLVRVWFLTLAMLMGYGSTLLAQQQQPPPPPPPPPPREGSAEVSFVGTSGNASTNALGLRGEYIVREAPWMFAAKAAYVRNETENVLQAQSFAASFRATRALNERWSVFGQYAYLRDTFAGIEHRNMIDGGVQYAAIRTSPHQLDLEAGIGWANEVRVVGETESSAQAFAGAFYKLKISETAELSDEVRLAASLADSADWRVDNTIALTAKLTTVFSLKVSNLVRYVNDPVPGFETTDTLTSVALVAKF